MDKVKILVACHKPGPVFQNDVYTPIHVGRAISNYKNDMADMIGDDTGDNISEKNPMYCELTAQYWAWKNLRDVEYVGFCHYRRFFDIPITNENVDSYFKNHDVLMIDNITYHTVISNLIKYVTIEDIHIFLMVLKKLYPSYEKDALDYLYGNRLHTNCMFICSKEMFDEYAEWLFKILFECEKYIKLSPYTRGKRVFAYLGEFFMSLFFLHHNSKIMKVGRVGVEEDRRGSAKYKVINFLNSMNSKFTSPILWKPKTLDSFYYPEVLVGLKNDGIKPWD